jgi:hypothetical protein
MQPSPWSGLDLWGVVVMVVVVVASLRSIVVVVLVVGLVVHQLFAPVN